MERTLDSIRPSDVESKRSNMSYLYGRDPSILAYGERPIPSTKQNLIALYEDEDNEYTDDTTDTCSDSITLQTVKVYLRVKPLPRKLKLSKEEAEAYEITNPTTLVTKLPSLDQNTSGLKGPKTADMICRKFTFTKTFGPETTQLHLFEQVIQQKMVDFLAGQNSTVMTYGTTNSGKSYTLQGTTTSPGIIPRGLDFVFSNISTRPTPSYKPTHNSDVVSLNAVDRAQELESKNKLLTFASIDKHHYINAYKQMQKLLREESPIRPSQACDAQYSVWVSFAEIYNENIYDLLSNESQKRRPLLKLGTDSHGRAFIKGLKAICVNSGSEAYQVLMAGQYNLKVAATALNARSSRSHCIFTIKLLKYYVENLPDSVEVSTFSFCDLAGSERLKKTLNVGERLKEAQNINTSLLVLGRCLKSIYEGQSIKQKHEHVGPFRESKLTRLFQRALSGKEQIALIVNVNPIPNLYVETQNVLNFSAIAKKIVVEPKQIKRRVSNSRFSQIVAQTVKSSTDWDETVLTEITEQTAQSEIDASEFIHQEEFDDIMAENKSLKKELAALKASMLSRDLQIRQELADTYTAMMKKLETDYKNRIRDVEEQQEDHLEWSVNRVETFYKEKISELTSRKRRRVSDDDDDDSDEEHRNIGELEIENSRLTAKIHSLKKAIKNLRATNENAITEKNKVAFELGLANEELKSVKALLSSAQEDLCTDGDTLVYIEKLRSELSDKQAHVKKLKAFLDEAKEEYISITQDAGAMEARLKVQAERLAESEERAGDLEELYEQVNLCLSERTKANEVLEERLNQQSILLQECKVREQSTQEKLIESAETIRMLREKVALLEKSSVHAKSVTPDSMLADVEIKEELETESETSLESPTGDLPEGIVIKTDNEILGIPATSYDNDRDSEMFVKVQEITVNTETDGADSLTELRAMLFDSKAENESLREKYEQSRLEIDSLRESFQSVKNQLSNVRQQLLDYRAAETADAEKKTLENSMSNKTCEPESLPRQTDGREADAPTMDNGCQTAAISERDQIIQTSFVDPGSEEKSVQTTIVDDEKSLNSQKEMEALRTKYDQLEAEYKKKEMSLEMFMVDHENHESEDELLKLREKYEQLEAECKKKENLIEKLKEELKNNESEDELLKLEVKYKQLEAECKEKETALEKLNEQLEHNESEDELKKLTAKYDRLKSKYMEKETLVEELKGELEDHESEDELQKLRIKYDQLKSKYLEKETSMEKLKEELEHNESADELEKLRIKYDQLESEYKEKETAVKKLQEELGNLRDSSESWHKKTNEDRESLEKSLASAIAEKEMVTKTLTETNELLKTLESQVSKCRDEHESKITDLEKELTVAKVREETKSECIKVQTDKIAEIESEFALRTKELEDKINEMTESAERCRSDKDDLEQKLIKNVAEIEALEKRVQSADKKEQEKDEEIRQLQKAIKTHLSTDIQDKKMEKEMKQTLKELSDTKEALARLEDIYQRLKSTSKKEIHDLENQISVLEKNAKLLEQREKQAQEEKTELVRLRTENEEFKISIAEKDREMESFLKNRDEMITKYEHWVKSQQEELERGKREITRFQELFHRLPSTPRKPDGKPTEDSLKPPIPVVDLSDSETKRTARRTALPPPSNCPSSDVKRSTRKKRLYQPVDDSCVDIEVCESVPPTPSPSSTRSLRTRRK